VLHRWVSRADLMPRQRSLCPTWRTRAPSPGP
jgi:hypothetical protein